MRLPSVVVELRRCQYGLKHTGREWHLLLVKAEPRVLRRWSEYTLMTSL